MSAWALVVILAAGGFAAVEFAPSLGLAGARPELSGARIPQTTRLPQSDPFDVGPPLFDNADRDFDTGLDSRE
jgi:hypothetical protein